MGLTPEGLVRRLSNGIVEWHYTDHVDIDDYLVQQSTRVSR